MISSLMVMRKGNIFFDLLIHFAAVQSDVAELFQLHKDDRIAAFVEVGQIDSRPATHVLVLIFLLVERDFRIEQSFSVVPNKLGLNRLLNSRVGCNVVLHML